MINDLFETFNKSRSPEVNIYPKEAKSYIVEMKIELSFEVKDFALSDCQAYSTADRACEKLNKSFADENIKFHAKAIDCYEPF